MTSKTAAKAAEDKAADAPEETDAAGAADETDAEDGATGTDTPEAVRRIIRRNMLWATGVSALPFRVIDTALLLGVQLKMLKELSDFYGVEFRANSGKSAVASLLGSVLPTVLGHSVVPSMIRGFAMSSPVIGSAIAYAAMPLFAGAFTYAIGKVFQRHFESGGTFLDLDTKKCEGFFKEKFHEGKDKAEAEAGASDGAESPAAA